MIFVVIFMSCSAVVIALGALYLAGHALRRSDRVPLISVTRTQAQWQWCDRCEREMRKVSVRDCPSHGKAVRSV